MVRKTQESAEKQIIEDYNNGIPISRILFKFHIGNTTLFRILNRNEISRRGHPKQRVKRIIKFCPICNKSMRLIPFIAKNAGKYCSLSCYWQSLTGKKVFDRTGLKPWNAGKTKGTDKRIKAPKTAFKKGKQSPYIGLKFEERYGREKAKSIKQKIREKTLEQYERGDFPKQTHTKPEMIFKEVLIQLGYIENHDFFHQRKMFDKFYCDFVFPKQKIIFEVQGDFWHANPIKYPYDQDNPKKDLHPHQVKGINRDKSKEAYLRKRGWVMIPFWEYDIKRNTKSVSIAVKNIINKIETINF